MSRHFIPVDEFQSFTTDAFASIFSEARKFAAYFCLANQYTKQIPETVRAAVLGNAGSFISFCVAAADAELLAPEFGVLPSALMEQLPFEAWLRRGNLEHAKITALPRAYPPETAAAQPSRKADGTSAAQVRNSTASTDLTRGTVHAIPPPAALSREEVLKLL